MTGKPSSPGWRRQSLSVVCCSLLWAHLFYSCNETSVQCYRDQFEIIWRIVMHICDHYSLITKSNPLGDYQWSALSTFRLKAMDNKWLTGANQGSRTYPGFASGVLRKNMNHKMLEIQIEIIHHSMLNFERSTFPAGLHSTETLLSHRTIGHFNLSW